MKVRIVTNVYIMFDRAVLQLTKQCLLNVVLYRISKKHLKPFLEVSTYNVISPTKFTEVTLATSKSRRVQANPKVYRRINRSIKLPPWAIN